MKKRSENRSSPWAHLSEKRQAEALKFNALDNEIRLAFREWQQESMESWCAWMEEPKKKDKDRQD